MNKISLLCTISLLIFSVEIIKAQATNHSYMVTSPCPENGVPVTKIDGVFTSSSQVKRNPVSGAGCMPSMEKTAYAEHFIKRGSENTVSVRFFSNNIRLDIYNKDYSPGEPCSNLIKSVQAGVWDTLQFATDFPILILVVSATTPVIDSLEYSIEFQKEVGRIPEKCLFSCNQRSSVLNLSFPFEPLETNIPETYQLKEKVKIDNLGCSQIAEKEHTITLKDTTFSVFSTYFLRPKLIETTFNLIPLELNCSMGEPSFTEILAQLSTTYAAEEFSEFSKLIDLLTSDKCGTDHVYAIYRFLGLEKVMAHESDTFKLRYDVVNWCAGVVTSGEQLFILKRSGNPQIVKDTMITTGTNPAGCFNKFKFPVPLGFTSCLGQKLNYRVEGNAHVYSNGDNYMADLFPGTYHFQYSVYDCCNTEPILFNITIKIIAPDIIISNRFFKVNLKDTLVVLNGNLLTTGNTDICHGIKSEFINSSTSCGDVIDNNITLCCNDLTYKGNSTVADSLLEFMVKVTRDDSNDGIFGNENDNYIIYTLFLHVFDQINGIQCPQDIKLPCTTTDTSPEVTGFAKVYATCFDSYKPLYRDVVSNPTPDKTMITRTFEFFGHQSVHRCQQKIELDCTVSSEDVWFDHRIPEVRPNPFQSSANISFVSETNDLTTFSVLNSRGQLMANVDIPIRTGYNTIELPAHLFPVAGLYIVDFQIDGIRHKVKLMKIE